MKKLISVILTLCLVLGTSTVVNASGSLETNYIDPMGNDPWLSYGHDAMITQFSPIDLGEEFEEADDWPFDSDAGQSQSLCRGSIAYDGILYTALYDGSRGGASTELIAIEIDTGEEVWRQEAGYRLSMSTPVINPDLGLVYVATTDGFGPKGTGETTVTAYTLEDGDEEWSSNATDAISSPLTEKDGYLYFKTMNAIFGEDKDDFAYKTDSSYCIKMDAETGDIEWEIETKGGEYLGWASPCGISGNYVYVASSCFTVSKQGGSSISIPTYLYCIDTESGDIEWEIVENSSFGSSLCLDDEFVYFSRGRIEGNSAEIVLSALSLDSGDEEWEFASSGCICFGTVPAVNEEYVFIEDNTGKLYVVDKSDGNLNWSKSVGDTSQFENIAIVNDYVIAYSPAISDNRLTGTSEMHILDASRRGKKIWKGEAEDIIQHVAVYGNKIFFTGKSEIFCIETLAPKLVVKPNKISLDKVERNTKTEVKLTLENDGVKGLEGTVEVDQEWLSIDIEKVSDEVKEATVTINTWNLSPDDYSGRIIFSTNGGTVVIPVLIVVVDEKPPVIVWNLKQFKEIEKKLYTNKAEITLQGETEPTAFVFINEEEVEIDADGFFEFSLTLKEGENTLLVEKEDDIGNQGKEKLVLYLDTKAPDITLATPDYTLSLEDKIYIIGQCSEENVVITLDDAIVELGKGGKFAVEVTLNRGENLFVIKGTDLIGNENVINLHIVYPEKKIIILQIGNNQAEVNGQIIILEAPPSIINGRTMVPLRFVSETFGAKLGWDGKEQKITLDFYGKNVELWIGRKTAMVSGVPMILEAPPSIINGRTMVPLRFCAETFGAEVRWDGPTQTITLIYPKS